jgi:hypothetical protein
VDARSLHSPNRLSKLAACETGAAALLGRVVGVVGGRGVRLNGELWGTTLDLLRALRRGGGGGGLDRRLTVLLVGHGEWINGNKIGSNRLQVDGWTSH